MSISKTPGEFDDSPVSRAKAAARAVLAFVIFPNLFFLLLSLFLYTNRGPINLDYAALGALWLWVPPWLRVTGFATLFVLDGIASTAAMYNIHPVTGVFALMKAPIGLILTVIAGALIALALAVAIGRFALQFLVDRRRRVLVSVVMAGVIMATLCVDVLIGGNRFVKAGPPNGFANLASSAALRFRWDLRDRMRSATDTYPVPAASDSLRAAIGRDAIGTDNVLLVLVESMGLFRDPTLRARVWQPIMSETIRARYSVRVGATPFHGGTTSGELRELCGIFADYMTLPVQVAPKCLPRMLHQRGYRTVAVHGYTAAYYNRSQWYPFYFDSTYFRSRLVKMVGARRCGTQFRGICDRDAIAVVGRLLHGPPPRLVYWMTLDAHTPVDMARASEFPKLCTAPPEPCLQAAMWHDMFARLAVLAMDPALPRTRILIVGDHAPAFVLRDRAAAFLPRKVPFVELTPRTLSTQ